MKSDRDKRTFAGRTSESEASRVVDSAATEKPAGAADTPQVVGKTMQLLRLLAQNGYTTLSIHPSAGVAIKLNLEAATFSKDGLSITGVILVSGPPLLEDRLRSKDVATITVVQAAVSHNGKHIGIGGVWTTFENTAISVSAEDVSVPV